MMYSLLDSDFISLLPLYNGTNNAFFNGNLAAVTKLPQN